MVGGSGGALTIRKCGKCEENVGNVWKNEENVEKAENVQIVPVSSLYTYIYIYIYIYIVRAPPLPPTAGPKGLVIGGRQDAQHRIICVILGSWDDPRS